MKRDREFKSDVEIKETKSNSNEYKIATNLLNVRINPGREFPIVRQLAKDSIVDVKENYVDKSTGITWGKIAEGEWIDMNFTRKV